MTLSVDTVKVVALPSDQDASGRTLGDEEIAAITEALRSGTLTCTKGRFTKEFEKRFAELMGLRHAHAVSSGTAAIHAALAAIDPEPGEEIITTPITDMGALTPILYQGAIPVFADVDPLTGNVTARTIAERLSDRTRAIVVTHLFGNPCDLTGILAVARPRGIPVIEDCAQAFEARHRGQKVGTFGAIGCFSMQQGKHITTGEGGIVVTDDADLARRMYLFLNKAWGYGDPNPDHYFLALNYRLSELQGAVAGAQLHKLTWVARRRRELAEQLTERLRDLEGIEVPRVADGDECTWWKYALRVDPQLVPGGAVGLAQRLKRWGVASAPRYIQKPAFQCRIFREQATFGRSRWPFPLARPEAVDYSVERFPGVFDYLEHVLVLPFNERYTEAHLDQLADAVRQARQP